jgi:hypothetical protein
MLKRLAWKIFTLSPLIDYILLIQIISTCLRGAKSRGGGSAPCGPAMETSWDCLFICPSRRCSGRGQCDSQGRCVCRSGWEGPDCHTPVCSPQCMNGGENSFQLFILLFVLYPSFCLYIAIFNFQCSFTRVPFFPIFRRIPYAFLSKFKNYSHTIYHTYISMYTQ